MDVLGSAFYVLRNLGVTQFDKMKDVRALASGLRVQSAADDPSGLAISETIQSKIDGLQQSVQNVQTANNAMNVAQAALAQVATILQRIRSLVVEARSDINSQSDLQNIQAEITQLLLEINKISTGVTFNGLTLFGGAYDTSQGTPPGYRQVASPFTAPDGSIPSTTVVNATGLPGGAPGPLITFSGNPLGAAGYFLPAFMVFQVTGYSDNAIDPDSGLPVSTLYATTNNHGVYVTFSAYANDPSMGAAPLFTDTTAVAVNVGPQPPGGGSYLTPPGSLNLLTNWQVANLTQADVGATMAFVSSAGTPAATGHPLNVNDGGVEGSTIGISLPTISTNVLNISNISVLDPGTVNYLNQALGQSSSNAMSAGAAEIQVDAALQQIAQTQAQVGAQTVALNADAGNASLTIVNETAAVSSIRDANIGQTVTDLTLQNILTNVGTAVLAQLEVTQERMTVLLFR